MRLVIFFIVLVTFLIGLTIALAGPAYRAELVDLRQSFGLIRSGTPLLMGGMALTLIGLLAGVVTNKRGVFFPSVLTLLFGGAILFAVNNMRTLAAAHPIHDITTDMESPPLIEAAAALQRTNLARYVGDDPFNSRTTKSVREVQAELYPDIQPIMIRRLPPDVFPIALAVAEDMGWEILNADPARQKIEATDTSLWFGFVDDVVIRIRLDGIGSIVDIRSKSRVGQSDLGANARRIRAYRTQLTAALQKEG